MEVFYQPGILDGEQALSPEESKHCIKVLRHRVGDLIHVADGRGTLFEVRITDANPRLCTFDIVSHTRRPDKGFEVAIAIAPTKSLERIEWFVEKVIELGVDELQFYFGRHSERKKLNMERLEKKAVAAMKQSEQFILPRIRLFDSFADCLAAVPAERQRFIAHVDPGHPWHLMDVAQKGGACTVFIGPEGDFSEQELLLAFEAGFTKVSLGPNRLRTETAGLVACHILNLINR